MYKILLNYSLLNLLSPIRISGNRVSLPWAATLDIKKSAIINQITLQLVERTIYKMESI